MKKEYSDHLARTFLQTQKKKKKSDNKFWPYVVISCLTLALFALAVNTWGRRKLNNSVSSTARSLVLDVHEGPYELKFDLTQMTGQTETLTIAMPHVNLSSYSRLRLSLRLKDAPLQDLGAVKIILANARQETADHYITVSGSSWNRFDIPLTSFKGLKDRSRVERLSFTLEPWNVRVKAGVLLVDSIEFLKN